MSKSYKLTNGAESTLGNWRKLCLVTFGHNSPQVRFLEKGIAVAARGENEPILAKETQMLELLKRISEK